MSDDQKTVNVGRGVDLNGKMTITPSIVRVTRGDFVNFSGCGAKFTVQFKGFSPFYRGYFTQADPPQQVHADARPGSYPYAIAVLDDNGEIYLDAATPMIENDW